MNISEISFIIKKFIVQGYYDEYKKVLTFDINKYNIALEIVPSIKNKNEISPSLGNDIINDPFNFKNIYIKEIFLTQHFLSYKEKSDDYNNELDYLNGHSLIYLQKYFKLFKEIPYYEIRDGKFEPMCPGPLTKYLKIDLWNLNPNEIEEFICNILDLQNDIKLTDSFSSQNIIEIDYKYKKNAISILSTKTKTRRIGYLKYFILQFNKSNHYPVSYFSKTIEKDIEKLNEDIENYRDTKGKINISRSGISSKPYIDLLLNLGIFTIVNNSYILTKKTKPYLIISKKILDNEFPSQDQQKLLWSNKSDNYFELNLVDKAFFLQQLLINDALYFWGLLDIIRIIDEPVSVSTIKKHFKNYILNELKRLNIKDRTIKEISKRIKNWKKEEVYLEHIIEPRLNWMLDIDIISFIKYNGREKIVKIEKSGIKLHKYLFSFYELMHGKSENINIIINHHYFKVLAFTYNLNKSQSKINQKILNDLIKESFTLFKTEAPKRIVASQAINYICYTYFFKYNKIVEFESIKNAIVENKSSFYGIDWFKSESDGSIFKK